MFLFIPLLPMLSLLSVLRWVLGLLKHSKRRKAFVSGFLVVQHPNVEQGTPNRIHNFEKAQYIIINEGR